MRQRLRAWYRDHVVPITIVLILLALGTLQSVIMYLAIEAWFTS